MSNKVAPEFKKNLDDTYKRLRDGLKNKPRDYEWRISQLKALRAMIVENEESIDNALWADYHKGSFESAATEKGIVLSEIEFLLSNLHSWMKPESASTPLINQLGTSEIRRDPYGLTLVIGAWNYPINLLLAPVTGAIAGGNAVIMKPSEMPSHTADLIAKLVPMYMDKDLFAVVESGPDETDALLDLKFDLIFFTGSGKVGKIVMQKAAQFLTPAVLELGGKSPAMVLPDADIKVSARRLVWGKFMNAGQTCVAPDYIMVDPRVKDELIHELKANIKEFYGSVVRESKDYCRIINTANFDRLMGLLEGSKVIEGGENDREARYIAPTLLDTTVGTKIMEQEIFGPLLPILTMPSLDVMIDYVNAHDKPLALYLFTQKNDCIEQVLNRTSSGGVSINDVIMHMASPYLPFGGVGASGMGNYHGEASFKTFTHAKSILHKSTLVDVPLRYAPYTETKLKWMKKLI